MVGAEPISELLQEPNLFGAAARGPVGPDEAAQRRSGLVVVETLFVDAQHKQAVEVGDGSVVIPEAKVGVAKELLKGDLLGLTPERANLRGRPVEECPEGHVWLGSDRASRREEQGVESL